MTEWMDKESVVYSNGTLFSHEKEGNPAICGNMSGSWKHYVLGELSQTEKEKYCMISLICEIWKSWTHKQKVEWRLPGLGVWGNGERLVRRQQTFSYKINVWGSKVKRVILLNVKIFVQKKKNHWQTVRELPGACVGRPTNTHPFCSPAGCYLELLKGWDKGDSGSQGECGETTVK